MRLLRRLIFALIILGGVVLATSFVSSERGDSADPTLASSQTTSYAPIIVEERSRDLPGFRELRAMVAAYPDRVSELAIREGEWAIRMDETWYFWADGRLLPGELRERAEEFVSIRFYRYRPGAPRQREINDALARRLRERTDSRAAGQTDTRIRFNSFLDTLYEISSQREADILVRPISFLGFRTRVHPMLVEPLERVEWSIRLAAERDGEVAEFVAGLASVHGYNWRNIAGTLRRSYHSYGVAVDLVPRSYGGTWPYWLWAAEGGITEWWDVPLEERWAVPVEVIEAFEREGFIWGGKWLSFDNLHFEYRPEALLMARWREDSFRASGFRQSLSP